MKGLKPYTHKDREKVIQEMVPLIKKRFGDNLVALAAQASFARNEDTDYSDLELIAFVKEMPEGKKWEGMGKVRDGLLVELVWTTKDNYLRENREVSKDWYIAGSDVMVPIINKEFIEELEKHKVENLREKCLKRAAERWNEVQESTAKVLNVIKMNNRENVSLLAFDMFLHMLRVMSFLNQTPYVTFSRFISQVKELEVKPEGFNDLIDIMVQGKYQDLTRLKRVVVEVFSGLERMLEESGFELYYDNVDPNEPMREFFQDDK